MYSPPSDRMNLTSQALPDSSIPSSNSIGFRIQKAVNFLCLCPRVSLIHSNCGYTKQFQEYVDIQFPKNYEPTLGFHLFGGEMKPERYKGIDKFIMRCMRDAIKTQDFEEDERRLHDLPEIYPENIAVLAKNISVALNNMQK